MSSFRQATPAYSVVKEFRGHKDGVWEVNVSKMDHHIIGTASAGKVSHESVFRVNSFIRLARLTQ